MALLLGSRRRCLLPDRVSSAGTSSGHTRSLLRETKMGSSCGLSTKRTLALVGVNSRILCGPWKGLENFQALPRTSPGM